MLTSCPDQTLHLIFLQLDYKQELQMIWLDEFSCRKIRNHRQFAYMFHPIFKFQVISSTFQFKWNLDVLFVTLKLGDICLIKIQSSLKTSGFQFTNFSSYTKYLVVNFIIYFNQGLGLFWYLNCSCCPAEWLLPRIKLYWFAWIFQFIAM